MPYVNKIEIMGNLGRNPELRYMPDGRAVTNVSVAVQKTWNDRETREQKERTEWFSVILYASVTLYMDSRHTCQYIGQISVLRAMKVRHIVTDRISLPADRRGNDFYLT